jgi:hypothetical protein
MHHDQIVANDVCVLVIVGKQAIVHVGPPFAQRRTYDGRKPPRVQQITSGQIQRQAQTKRDTVLDLSHTLLDLFRGQQINPATLIIGPKITPSRAFWTLYPSC